MLQSSAIKNYSFSSLQEIKLLGYGNFAATKLYYHKDTKKHVAGKTFSISGDNQRSISQQKEAAKREAKILARIKHENIARVLGTTEWEGNCFAIILEFIAYGDLGKFLQQDLDKPIPWKLRARFFTELAAALNYLHYHDPKRSFIHGDLKPENVLLGDKLNIKLADFGAAAIIARLTIDSSLSVGEGNTQHTPYYTAPEYLRRPTKERCCSMDVYSYGMIGYEILTRRRVFDGCQVRLEVLVILIVARGEKPNNNCLKEVANMLEENPTDKEIFQELKQSCKSAGILNPKSGPK